MPARLAVLVMPRAGRDEIVGWREGELSVHVTVPPEGGRANAAVCALLAKVARVPKTSVSVVRGSSSRHKAVEFATLSESDVAAAFPF